MAGIETKESSTGAKLLTANTRNFRRVRQQQSIPIGLTSIQVQLAPPSDLVAPGGDPNAWQVSQNRRYKFSATTQVEPINGKDAISIESAGLTFGFSPPGTIPQTGYGTAARLSALTALAFETLVSVDDFVVDCNDLLGMFNAFVTQEATIGIQPRLWVTMLINLNNAGIGAHDIAVPTVFSFTFGDFDAYRFDKWE